MFIVQSREKDWNFTAANEADAQNICVHLMLTHMIKSNYHADEKLKKECNKFLKLLSDSEFKNAMYLWNQLFANNLGDGIMIVPLLPEKTFDNLQTFAKAIELYK